MTHNNVYPPHYMHSSKLISPTNALRLLSRYLEAAETDASLHPNALLTENGPVSATQGANLGLVLYNLKRVEAGLRGEHLSEDLPSELGGEAPKLQNNSTKVASTTVQGLHTDGQRTEPIACLDDWQDKAEFEREQDIEQGENEDRIATAADNALNPNSEPAMLTTLSTEDKALRKQRKRQRHLEEKRAKQEAKKNKSKSTSDG